MFSFPTSFYVRSIQRWFFVCPTFNLTEKVFCTAFRLGALIYCAQYCIEMSSSGSCSGNEKGERKLRFRGFEDCTEDPIQLIRTGNRSPLWPRLIRNGPFGAYKMED